MGHGAWSKEHGARGKEHGAWGMEHEAWEGRTLGNDPVGHFSEGARLQGGHTAWSKEQSDAVPGSGDHRALNCRDDGIRLITATVTK